MVDSRQPRDREPIDIGYFPPHRLLPAQVLRHSDVLQRMGGPEMTSSQRAGFHILFVCIEGAGAHEVDFERVPVAVGTVLRIRPGQVHHFVQAGDFDALMVLWPPETEGVESAEPVWTPGGTTPTHWRIERPTLTRVTSWIGELDAEQKRFDGSPARIELTRLLLRTLLLRLRLEQPAETAAAAEQPAVYSEFLGLIERRFQERPTVDALAGELGYSTRTIDRACRRVSGRTAKRVLDERTVLEARRLLTHTSLPINRIARSLGFTDPSNFSKFVHRNLGQQPHKLRHFDARS
ncbi:MAG: AraC family transcriptional regulator [Actinomycetota bacterium]